MRVLGLQFGHDGAACLVEDGRVLAYVCREREARVKHVIGLTTNEINLVLDRAGIDATAIDFISIVSTQNVEILAGLIEDFEIRFERHRQDTIPSPYADLLALHGKDVQGRLSYQLRQLFQHPDERSLQYQLYRELCIERDAVRNGSVASTGWLDQYLSTAAWDRGATLSEIARRNASSALDRQELRFGFHYPVVVGLRGRDVPAYFVHHHVAHAASCFFRSGFDEAAILTHDGFSNGVGYQSGFILYGRGNQVMPLSPHHLAIGGLYDRVGNALNLGWIGAAGKLMGLAPYGQPTLYHPDFVGNWYDIDQRHQQGHAEAWMRHCVETLTALGYDKTALGDPDRITEPVNADLAASTQKLFEECYLATAHCAYGLLRQSGIPSSNLCLSGGTALNCPSNSRILGEGPFDRLFVEPSCGDDGLAIGSALYVIHQLYGLPVDRAAETGDIVFLGHRYSEQAIQSTLARHAHTVQVEWVADTARRGAEDLRDNKVIAWFEGGSEAGPRALGHRSLVAHPGHVENWRRVNRIKGREWWRPLAPSVLAEEAPRWFSGLPVISPYMLFTGQVISDKLPAIRHVDGSARVQTVDASVGEFYRLLTAWAELSGLPVVLNTSLNGPGEPLIETPEQAVAFLLETEVDALYMPGCRVTRFPS